MGGVITDSTDTVNYKAYLTGRSYEHEDLPKLDSIKLNTSHQIINTTNTITITKTIKQKQSRWNISPAVGFGYGVFKHETDVYVGLSIGYRIF